MAEYDFTKAKDGDIFYATIDKAIGVEKFVVRDQNKAVFVLDEDNVFYINSFLTHSSMIWEKGVKPSIPLFTNRIDAENYNRNKDNEYLEQLQSKYPTLNDIIKLLYESASPTLSDDYVLREFIDTKLKEFNIDMEEK
jgi:hypothetical protein